MRVSSGHRWRRLRWPLLLVVLGAASLFGAAYAYACANGSYPETHYQYGPKRYDGQMRWQPDGVVPGSNQQVGSPYETTAKFNVTTWEEDFYQLDYHVHQWWEKYWLHHYMNQDWRQHWYWIQAAHFYQDVRILYGTVYWYYTDTQHPIYGTRQVWGCVSWDFWGNCTAMGWRTITVVVGYYTTYCDSYHSYWTQTGPTGFTTIDGWDPIAWTQRVAGDQPTNQWHYWTVTWWVKDTGPYTVLDRETRVEGPYVWSTHVWDTLKQAHVHYGQYNWDRYVGPTWYSQDYEFQQWETLRRDLFRDLRHQETWRIKVYTQTGYACGAPDLPVCHFGGGSLISQTDYWANYTFTDTHLSYWTKTMEGPFVTTTHVYDTPWVTVQTDVPYGSKWRVRVGVDVQPWFDVFRYAVHQMAHDRQHRYEETWQVYLYTQTGYLCGAPDLPVCHFETGRRLSQVDQYQWVNPHEIVVGQFQDRLGILDASPAPPLQLGHGGVYRVDLFAVADRNAPADLSPGDQTQVTSVQVALPWGQNPSVTQVGASDWRFALSVPSRLVVPDGSYQAQVTVTGVDPDGGAWTKRFPLDLVVQGDASNPFGSILVK